MDAHAVKDALRKRYPGIDQFGVGPGEWTCLEEWWNIDLLAMSAWSRGKFIGHEVKVSRSDYKSELYKPDKRKHGMLRCDQFYFCIPKGLLKKEELEFVEPEWQYEDFRRTYCPDHCVSPRESNRWKKKDQPKNVGYGNYVSTDEILFTSEGRYGYTTYRQEWQKCATCDGKGYIAKSRVETDAPMLWVPKDVGLIECTEDGTRVVKQAPYNHNVVKSFSKYEFAQAMRWASFRPDVRHRAKKA